jgi:hypothetical protein
VVRRRPLRALERHSGQSHHALGRRDRYDERVSQAVELRQRQHPGSSGTAPQLRARAAARVANLPERCANLCFGGSHRNRLFMAASTSLYSLYVNTQGVLGG